MNTAKKYQPSNGTEGMQFIETHCMICVHCDPNPDGKMQCEILARTMAFDAKDKEYPEAWTYDSEGSPICTKYQLWDWESWGTPRRLKRIVFDNPNQLKLFKTV